MGQICVSQDRGTGRLVFINSFSDAEGGVTRHPLSPTWPLEVLSTVTFAEHDGKTTVTLKGIPVNATELEIKTFEDGYPSMQQGFGRTLDKLAAYLERLDTGSSNHQPAQEHVMHLNPYLHFNGRCEEAFKFYEQVLGGKIVVMVRREGTPAAEHTPAEWRNKILHARLIVDGELSMGSDVPPERFEEPKGFSVTFGVPGPADEGLPSAFTAILVNTRRSGSTISRKIPLNG